MFIENNDGLRAFIVNEPREKITLICPGCSYIERVDKQRWATQAILNNQATICSACGIVLEAVPEIESE
ncbi:MAG TPA: hypothetical protein PLS49_07295 [Candidatus Woesebacteria bacterium]|nr:hypothetical protein [Candidatus Woesebacteria bacterium]